MKGEIAIGYIRLSDRNQVKGGGIESQETGIRKRIKDAGMVLYKNKVFIEVFTGSTSISDRPVYTSLLKEIQQSRGKIKYFVIKKIDRSSRAGSQEYIKMKVELRVLGVDLIDAEMVIQPSYNRLAHRGVSYDWSNTSPSHLAEIILAEVASEDRKNILTRTVDTSVNRIEVGFKVRPPNYGYENKKIVDKDGKEKYIQIRYEPEAKFIDEIFRLSATTPLTDEEIVSKVNAMGCKTRTTNIWNKANDAIIGKREGVSLTVKQMQRWRKNTIYAGIIIEDWGKIEKKHIVSKAQYEGLVSVDAFNRANKGKVYIELHPDNKVKVLYNQKPNRDIKRRQKFRKDFIFKNVILCSECKKTFKASSSRSKNGKYVPSYHCDRGHKYVGYNRKEFETRVHNFLDRIKFSDKHYWVLEKSLTSRFRSEISKLNKSHISVSEKEISLRTELNEIEISIQKSSSDIVRKQFEKKYEDKYLELNNVKDEKEDLTIDEDELNDFLQELKILVEHPKNILMDVHSFEQQIAVWKLFFQEFPTYDEIISGTPKLTLFFKLLSEIDVQKEQLVTLRGIEPRLQP